MIANASHIANARRRQRHHQLLFLWVMARSRRDLVEVSSGPRRKHERTDPVDKSCSAEPAHSIRSSERAAKLAGDLIDRPRPARVDDEAKDAFVPVLVANGVLELRRVLNTMVGHRKVQPFGVTALGQFALSPGPISRMRPTLDFAGDGIKQFRYTFRWTLLVSRRRSKLKPILSR
ncbi:MAG TPA: hypothetical protein VHU13_00215 [Solirubrobacteraceae bacterium]|nr:hypothetical protein [Solirubrobacteraceae bacterium]